MSENKGEEVVVFDKDTFREYKAELRRIDCRRDHVTTELDGAQRKVAGLQQKLADAEAMLKDKEAMLLPELKALEKSAVEIKEAIEALNG